MLKKLQYSILLVFIAGTFAGCVGTGTVTKKSYSWNLRDKSPSDMGVCPIAYDKMIVSCSKEDVQKMSPAKLSEIWGMSKSDKIVNGDREIIYDQKLAWRGIVLFLGVPIPLLIPLGYDEARFVFHEGLYVHADYADNELNATICGLHREGPNGFGCIANWH